MDELSLPSAPPPAKMRSLADPRTPRKDLTTTFAATSPSAVGVELVVASPAELPPQLVVPGSTGGADAESDKDAILRPTRSKLQRTSIPAAASGPGKSKPLYLKVSEAFFWITLVRHPSAPPHAPRLSACTWLLPLLPLLLRPQRSHRVGLLVAGCRSA